MGKILTLEETRRASWVEMERAHMRIDMEEIASAEAQNKE